jgi:Na+-transporting NADH:ubiquinone oxidoreductase subunit C
MLGDRSARYTFGFAATVCAVCSILVSGSAVMLAPLRQANELMDRRRNVLLAGGLIVSDSSVSSDTIERLYSENVLPVLVDRKKGIPLAQKNEALYDYHSAQANPGTSKMAKPNGGGVVRLPDSLMTYEIMADGKLERIVIPIQGKGLWSTLYGFLALDGTDLGMVKAIAFYEHGETPGLGGEVDNPKWQAGWNGRRAFNDSFEPVIGLVKGGAGSVTDDPHGVDALSGATMTSNGVTAMVRFWLGEQAYGPYLKRRILGDEH